MNEPPIEVELAHAFSPNLSLFNGPLGYTHQEDQRSALGVLPVINENAAKLSFRIGDAAGVDALFKTIRAAVLNPVCVLRVRGRLFVGVTGVAVFGVEPDGRWSCWLWGCDFDGVVSLKRVGKHEIAVADCPGGAQWMQFFVRVYRARSGLSSHFPAWAVNRFESWLTVNLRQRLWSRRLRKAVRLDLAKVMRWDRKALARADSVVLHAYFRHPIRFDAYEQALIHAPAYDIVLGEAPALAALVDQFAEDIVSRGPDGSVAYSAPGTTMQVDIKLALRGHLLAHGVRPGFWRMLTRLNSSQHLRAWFEVCLEPFYDEAMRQPGIALSLLRLAQAADPNALVDSADIQQMLEVVACRTGYKDEGFEAAAMPVMPFLGHLSRLEQSASMEDRLRLAEQKRQVLDWADEQICNRGVSSLLRLPLETILRRSDPERMAQWRHLTSLGDFPVVPALPVDHPMWEILPLRSGRDLWLEGQRMCHCVADRAGRAVDGDSMFISVRLKGKTIEQERPLATAEISLKSKVRMAEIKGFANGPVQAELIRFVRHFAASVRGHRNAERRQASLAHVVDHFELRTAA